MLVHVPVLLVYKLFDLVHGSIERTWYKQVKQTKRKHIKEHKSRSRKLPWDSASKYRVNMLNCLDHSLLPNLVGELEHLGEIVIFLPWTEF